MIRIAASDRYRAGDRPVGCALACAGALLFDHHSHDAGSHSPHEIRIASLAGAEGAGVISSAASDATADTGMEARAVMKWCKSVPVLKIAIDPPSYRRTLSASGCHIKL